MWTYIFCITFFPHCTKEWNQLNDDIKKVESIKKLKNKMLNLNHLNEHKFRNNFNNIINPMCNCSAATETTIHYLLRCWLYSV